MQLFCLLSGLWSVVSESRSAKEEVSSERGLLVKDLRALQTEENLPNDSQVSSSFLDVFRIHG